VIPWDGGIFGFVGKADAVDLARLKDFTDGGAEFGLALEPSDGAEGDGGIAARAFAAAAGFVEDAPGVALDEVELIGELLGVGEFSGAVAGG